MLAKLISTFIVLLMCSESTFAVENVDWWESATFYQIYPRSFMDSNGDGVGDLNGITERLEYLKEIGITAAWISPIYESPMADMGYDISNYTAIDPLFGTMDDFDAIIVKAHTLGLKILMDFVPNHSSDKHEWFRKSISREDGYDDFYTWDDGKIDEVTGERIPPNNWRSVLGGSAWTWNEERQQFYFHQFFYQQPDLNLRNPIVRQRLIEVMEFWLGRGVDGFRVDAIMGFFEKRLANGTYPDNTDETNNQADQPETLELLYEWRKFLDKYQQMNGGDTRVMLGESYSAINVLSDYIGNGIDYGVQLPMNLNFNFMVNITTSYDIENAITSWMSVIWKKHKTANWVASTHDNSRFSTRIGYKRADIMTMLIHALPGASIVYYGEEIGMTDAYIAYRSRDPERAPMHWDTSKNAGFSTANSTWIPVNPNYKLINVKTERGRARSSLQIFKEMIKLKQTAAFKAFKEDGGFEYGPLSDQVFQVVRTNKATEEYRVLTNLGDQIEYFDSLSNKTFNYVVLNSYSPHTYGEKVDLSKRFYLMPYEAVALRWTAWRF